MEPVVGYFRHAVQGLEEKKLIPYLLVPDSDDIKLVWVATERCGVVAVVRKIAILGDHMIENIPFCDAGEEARSRREVGMVIEMGMDDGPVNVRDQLVRTKAEARTARRTPSWLT